MKAGSKVFSDGDLIKMGWVKTKEKFGFIILTVIVAFLIIYVPPVILDYIGRQLEMPGVFGLLSFLAFFLISIWIGVGMIRIFLGLVDGKEVSMGDLFKGADRILDYLAVMVLYTLIVFVGMILLVFPGIIWSIKYIYAPLLVIDKGLGPIEALKASAELTNGVKWDILAFQGVLGYVILIGYAALIIGSVVAIPVAILALIGMYRHHMPAGKSAPMPKTLS
jgi:uncharacterized membrane protein